MNKMKINKHRQKGLSGPGWMVVIAIFSLLALTFFKVYPMYYDNYLIKSVLQSVQEDASLDVKSKRAIWESMEKKLFINEVHVVTPVNVKMSRKDGKTTITVSYETQDDYIGNLFIGGKFVETVVIDR